MGIAILGAVVLSSACMGGLGQSGVERRVGHATREDILDEVPRILGDHGYTIYNARRTDDVLYLETNWRSRAPFEDEEERGVKEARTRIIIRARRSSATFFTVRLAGQNQVRGLSSPTDPSGSDWSTIPATAAYHDYIRELSTEIRLEVDAGNRRGS